MPAAGVGHHLQQEDQQKAIAWGKSIVALEWLYLASSALPKLYVLFLYLRVFTTRKAARIGCIVLISFTTATWIAFTIASATKCRPFAAQWDRKLGHCVNVQAFYQSTSAPNIITDLAILLLPVPTVRRLQASRLRRFSILLIFLTGSV